MGLIVQCGEREKGRMGGVRDRMMTLGGMEQVGRCR